MAQLGIPGQYTLQWTMKSLAIWRSTGCVSFAFLIAEKEGPPISNANFTWIWIASHSYSPGFHLHNYSQVLFHCHVSSTSQSPSHLLNTNNLTLLPILVTIYNACICFCSVSNLLTFDLYLLFLLEVKLLAPTSITLLKELLLNNVISSFLFYNNIW